jgi:hypothetical protein
MRALSNLSARKRRAGWEEASGYMPLASLRLSGWLPTWTALLTNCHCSYGLLALIRAPHIIVAEHYSSHR